MLQFLIDLDQKIFLFLNHAGCDVLDPVMLFISSMWIWAPVFVLTAILLYRKAGVRGIVSFAFIIVTIIVTDQSSVHLFKEVFQRLRPCHDPLMMDKVRLVADHCGGQYSFVSSHAANSFGLMMVSAGLINKKPYTLFILFWAIIISYSRVYLGVHYPGDILGGSILGLFAGFLVLKAHNWTQKKINTYAQTKKA